MMIVLHGTASASATIAAAGMPAPAGPVACCKVLCGFLSALCLRGVSCLTTPLVPYGWGNSLQGLLVASSRRPWRTCNAEARSRGGARRTMPSDSRLGHQSPLEPLVRASAEASWQAACSKMAERRGALSCGPRGDGPGLLVGNQPDERKFPVSSGYTECFSHV